LTIVPVILPESAAVDAHADPERVACPVSVLLLCWIATVPATAIPYAVDAPVSCQLPVRVAFDATWIIVADQVPESPFVHPPLGAE
jgi:hypothetical protein